MTTDRVFSGAMDTFPAVKKILNNGGAYDDRLVRAFCELMGPTGLAKL